jgi:hypothetical protein
VSTPTAILTAIDTQIAAIVADPDDIVSYRIGDKQVSKSEKMEYLLKAREVYQKIVEKEPYEDIRHIALDFDEFGIDESELIGDEV